MYISPEIFDLNTYFEAWQTSINDPDTFWAKVADTFLWQKKWSTVCQGNFIDVNVRWFDGASLNLSENCIDRHLKLFANHPAIVWEPNDPSEASQTLTFQELHDAVCQFANGLKQLGAKNGDRVCIYMPMVPQAAIAMLACARIGAIHTVVFGGFSAQSLAERINDSGCKFLITADGGFRGDKIVPLKNIVDEALKNTPSIEKVIVFFRTYKEIQWTENRDIAWQDVIKDQPNVCIPEYVEAEQPLFILYTSGSTGKPKGVVHTTGGYMTYVGYTFRNVFQIRDKDIFWCTADVGWVTGHSYLVYGPLLNACTTLMFEGVPTFPNFGRFWEIIDKHQVNIFYTAPTAIRSLEAFGQKQFENKNLGSLRILGTVGEPINTEAWEWYHKNVGKNKLPIVDTWWQTETGGVMISPIAGITPLKPTFATLPMPGILPVLINTEGKPIEQSTETVEGNLCIAKPWPSMARTTYNDHQRFKNTYFSTYPGYYFTGDGCFKTPDGNYRITGRVDDVLNVSGHRIGTAEIENAIDQHECIIESAVVGYPHDIKGQGIYAYVICDPEKKIPENMTAEIRDKVSKMIGAFAKPDKIQIVGGLPKTRSGKIMRRILRKIAEGETQKLGDISTLLDPNVVDDIAKNAF